LVDAAGNLARDQHRDLLAQGGSLGIGFGFPVSTARQVMEA